MFSWRYGHWESGIVFDLTNVYTTMEVAVRAPLSTSCVRASALCISLLLFRQKEQVLTI